MDRAEPVKHIFNRGNRDIEDENSYVASRSFETEESDGWATVKRFSENYGFNNFTVIISTIFVVGLFIVMIIVVVYLKKHRQKKQKQLLVVKQTDPKKKGCHPYLITVNTGSRCGSGTNGYVRMRIHGKQDISNEFYLNPFIHDPEKKTFERSRVSRFVVFSKDLGDLYLTELDLQSKEATSWFLSYIVIQDVTTLQQWYFPYHKWIKISEGTDVKVDILAGVVSSGRLFIDNVFSGYRKHHMWYKLFVHLNRSTKYNSILSLSYCNSLVMCFMFANTICAGILNLSHISTWRSVPLEFYGYSMLANTIVAGFTSALEVLIVMIEHRNRFDDLENRGTLGLNSALGDALKLVQLDSSVWREHPDGHYYSFDYFDDDGNNHYEFHPIGIPYFHTNLEAMKGIKLYSPNWKGLKFPHKSSLKEIPHKSSLKDRTTGTKTNGRKPNNPLCSPEEKESLYAAIDHVRSTKNNGYLRNLAKANDSSYYNHIDVHHIPLEKNLSWNGLAEMYLYEKNNPVMSGQSLYNKAIIPVTQTTVGKGNTQSGSPIYVNSQKVKGVTYAHNKQKVGPYPMAGKTQQTNLFRPVIDYTGKKDFQQLHTNYGAVIQNTDKINGNKLSEKPNLVNEVETRKANNVNDVAANDKIINDEMQKLVMTRLENYVDQNSTLLKDKTVPSGKPQKATLAERETLKQAIHPLITSFCKDVQSSLLENRELDGNDFIKFETGILNILQKTCSSDLVMNIQEKRRSLSKSSSLTGSCGGRKQNSTHSDTVLNAGVSGKRGVNSCSNLSGVSDTVCCEKVYATQAARPSIEDIQNSMQMGNAAKKLSDAVLSCSLTKNICRMEKTAEDILNSSKKSREMLLTALCKSLDIDPNLEDAILFKAILCRDDSNVTQKTSSQLIDEKVPKSLIPKIKKDHVTKTAHASLQSILSHDIKLEFEDIVKNYGMAEMNAFASEVVDGLYVVVRKKLEKLIALDMEMDNGQSSSADNCAISSNPSCSTTREKESSFSPDVKWKQFQTILKEADIEIKHDILPVITEHIVNLIEEEAHTLESLDLDLMMMAFGGQFVDTVITNAVLQTHVGVVKYCQELKEHEKNKESILLKEEPQATGKNKSASNANALSPTSSKSSYESTRASAGSDASNQNLITTFSDVLSHNFNDLKSLINEQIVTKVLILVHEKLGHKSNLDLESFIENGKICCALCKPKIVNDLVRKIPHMSAASYITDEVLHQALSELDKLQDIQLQMIEESSEKTTMNDHSIVNRKKSNNSLVSRYSSHTIFRTIGELITLKQKTGLLGTDKDCKLIENIVSDLTEYIMEKSCDTVALILISLMEEECKTNPKAEGINRHGGFEKKDVKNADCVVHQKVKQIVDGKIKAKKPSPQVHNSNNNNNTDDIAENTYEPPKQMSVPVGVQKQMNDIYEKYSTSMPNMARHYSALHQPINRSKSWGHASTLSEEKEPLLTSANPPEHVTTRKTSIPVQYSSQQIMNNITVNSPDENNYETSYHTYRYDDSAKYRAGSHTCLFQFIYAILMLLSVVTLIGTLIIGIGLSDTVAVHWLICVLIAIASHIFIFESVKILFLALVATYGGHRLL